MKCSITFRARAETNFGDTLVLVGGSAVLGEWDPWNKGVRLSTTPEDYPIWSSAPLLCDVSAGAAPLEYKYVRLCADGGTEWEVEGDNRKVPAAVGEEAAKHLQSTGNVLDFVVDDGHFGRVPAECCGYPAQAASGAALTVSGTAGGPQLLVLGDDIVAGAGAWCFNGWGPQLVKALNGRFGYGSAARAGKDMDVYKAEKEFEQLVGSALPKPTAVLLAFSGGLKHVATCPDWDREPSCNAFLGALEGLVSKAFSMGVYPVIAGLCPNGDSGEEQAPIWRQTQERMHGLGVPVLNWLHLLAASHHNCSWAEGLSQDAVRPNGRGHAKMVGSVDQGIFDPAKVQAVFSRRDAELDKEKLCFSDGSGFQISFAAGRGDLIISNSTKNQYELNSGWGQLQDSLAAMRRESPWSLQRGLYVYYEAEGGSAAVALDSAGRIASGDPAVIPAGRTFVFQTAKSFTKSSAVKPVFAAGPLSIHTCARTGAVLVLNEASFEYNVHPMWNEARVATRKLPEGIYEDSSGRPFRTAIISLHGLQSRIKVPAGSMLRLAHTGKLSSIERVALLPLGDRCSIRMLLHKIELDGPCYPFDLTRTTSLADVADMVGSGFQEMWYEELLHYDHDAGRIFHKKWGGLSYAHEVDDGDDPVNDFHHIAVKMAKRYAGRAARFDFAVKHADRVMFIRTGCASRGEVENLLQRVHERYPGIQANLLLISDQPSHEFDGIAGMTHVCEAFDPDRMYEDMNYWINCSHRFRGILERFGITARTIYWCPNNLKEAEKEMREAADLDSTPSSCSEGEPGQAPLPSRDAPMRANFSHSNLFDLERRTAHGGVPSSGSKPVAGDTAADGLSHMPDHALGA